MVVHTPATELADKILALTERYRPIDAVAGVSMAMAAIIKQNSRDIDHALEGVDTLTQDLKDKLARPFKTEE